MCVYSKYVYFLTNLVNLHIYWTVAIVPACQRNNAFAIFPATVFLSLQVM